jgi:hypothetical protein
MQVKSSGCQPLLSSRVQFAFSPFSTPSLLTAKFASWSHLQFCQVLYTSVVVIGFWKVKLLYGDIAESERCYYRPNNSRVQPAPPPFSVAQVVHGWAERTGRGRISFRNRRSIAVTPNCGHPITRHIHQTPNLGCGLTPPPLTGIMEACGGTGRQAGPVI